MKRIYTFLAACIGGLVITASCCAQPYYFRHYQTENGLSFNSVFACTQDKQGFMWFATRDGLNRFDGYTFKVFKNDPEVAGSIGANFIYDLYTAPDSTLWVSTQTGLYRYNASTETFSPIKETLGGGVRSIVTDRKGGLWFIRNSALCRYDLKKSVFRTYPPNRYFLANSITIDEKGTIWIASNNGQVERYDERADDFTAFDAFAHSPKAASKRIECIYSTRQGSLLLGTSNQGIKLFDIATATYKDIITLNSNNTEIFARSFIKSGPDEFWCATESGIYIYNIKTGKYINLKKNDNDPYSLSDNAVYSLCKDTEGGIFAGTYFGGINYYPHQYSNFEKYFQANNQNSITGHVVREICQDKYGSIWIGTEDAGLNRYDPATRLFRSFIPTGNKGSIAYTNIHGLLARGNDLWIGTYEHGLDIMDVRTGMVTRHYAAGTESGLRSNFIVTIYQTKAGKVLVGTSQGLYQYDDAAGKFILLSVIPLDNLIYAITEDHSGTIWVATLNNGLYYFQAGSNRQGHLGYSGGKINQLSSNMITSVFEDSRNNLWLTTETGGVCRLSPDRKTFKTYNTKNGLPSNFVFKVLEDNNHKLWITTTKGLACLNPVSGQVKTYTKANGLLNDQFNYNSAFKDGEGNMYFGSIKGMVKFNPYQLNNSVSKSPVYITGLQVDNKDLTVAQKNSVLERSVPFSDRVDLSHDQNTISIDIAALSFTAPEMTAYMYKMDGLEHNWTYLRPNRKVYFTQLPPGKYVFKVKADNGDNHWNSKSADLTIVIHPPFWASIWAYLFYIISGGTGLYYLLRFYTRYLKDQNRRKIDRLENEKEKEIYQAKIEFFTNIAHEIRTPLTLIKAPLEIVKASTDLDEIKENAYVMDKNADRLLNLTNQLLDFRKTEIKGFSLNFIKTSISAMLHDIYMQFKPATHLKHIQFELKVPNKPVYAYVDPEALNKILSNVVSNAVKYAGDSVIIKLSHLAAEGLISIEIKNNGDLVPADLRERIFEPFFRLNEHIKQTGTGIGLALARSLVQLHNGKLELVDSGDSYNTFVLQLPEHQYIEFEFASKDDVAETSDTNEAEQPAASDKPNILVVEDTKDILQFMVKNLSPLYTVITATNGQIALNKLAETPVQLVITDVMMPVMDGYELCKQIKTNFEYSHVPVIMLTAKNALQSKIEGLGSGADAYVEKPFSPEFLQAQIASMIENRAKVKAYFARSPLIHIKSIAHSKADEIFLEKLNNIIIKNIGNIDLDPEKLAEMLFMSRPTLFRKIKAVANLTPNDLINLTRLKKAAELLAEGNYKIYEVADMTGFSSPTVFARIFHKQFGISPSEYANSQKANANT